MSIDRATGVRPALMLAVAAAASAALSACGGSSSGAAAADSTVPTAPVPATPAPTSTTVAPTTTADPNSPPPAPQPTAGQAASAFIHGWTSGDRPRAASVATPAAVATLFGTPYGGQPLTDRGCTDAFPPIECTWGPYGGGSGSIYQIQVTQVSGGWYVDGVTIDS